MNESTRMDCGADVILASWGSPFYRVHNIDVEEVLLSDAQGTQLCLMVARGCMFHFLYLWEPAIYHFYFNDQRHV